MTISYNAFNHGGWNIKKKDNITRAYLYIYVCIYIFYIHGARKILPCAQRSARIKISTSAASANDSTNGN